jgi:pyruvate dehydrogenase E2 component (dihydrolipoamide acetyltransferase)
MGYVVTMPNLGMSMATGEVLQWFTDPEDTVADGDRLLEIEAEKTTAEVAAKEDGVLRERFAEVGDAGPPGAPLAIVADEGADVGDLMAEAQSRLDDLEPADTDASAGDDGSEQAAGAAEGAAVDDERPTDETGDSSDGTPSVSPRARRRAAELEVDIDQVASAVDGGTVTEDDIDAWHERQTTTPRLTPRAKRRAEELGLDPSDVPVPEDGSAVTADDLEPLATEGPATRTVRTERELDGMRGQIADRLSESYRQAVHVTAERSVDVEPLFAAVETARAEVDGDISVQDLFLRAVSRALSDHPAFNATFEDGVHRQYEEHNVGVAVDVTDGLLTPVVPDVASKSLSELSAARRDLTERVQAGEYDVDDLAGGTFTVSNLGPLDVDSFTPIINPPEVAILGLGRAERRAVHDSEGTTSRRHLTMSLSFDHRVVDGADAARFLESVAESVTEPGRLLPEGVGVGGGDTDAEQVEPGGRRATASNDDGLAGDVDFGEYAWRFDEPTDVGGGGTAPTPVDHFLGSLASCLAVSTRSQAEKYDADLASVDVDVTGRPDHGRIESIDATLALESDADDETVERLVESAKRICTVSNLIRDDVGVDVQYELV